MEKYFQRINYQGKLEDISLNICKDFQIGDFLSNKLISVGYEDFNYILETTKGRYLVKIFSSIRSNNDCQRYLDVMLKVVEAKVSFPKLFESKDGFLYKTTIADTHLRLCVMEFIDGDDYYHSGQKLTADEIRFLAQQTALINSIDIRPEFVYDHWAIVNFLNEFQEKKQYLSEQDLAMIEPLVEKFGNINIEKLPYCFAHGDIIATNVMKDKNGKIWIIDFAASNYYPRIQELAVLACNMLFDEKDMSKSESNLKIALEEYQKTIQLAPRELEVLPIYINFAHAMHILLANYEKVVENNNSKENEYWLEQGRAGLH